MSQLLPPYPFIHGKLAAGKVIPFLGSGASLGGRGPGAKWERGTSEFLPTASELATLLAETTQFPADEPPDLTKVAQYYSVVGGRDALNEELHAIFNRDYPVTPLHNYLAAIEKPMLIVTTNYDDLIERALKARERPFDVVIHTTDMDSGDKLLWWPHGEACHREVNPNKLDIDLDAVTVIYKMHGAVDRNEQKRDQYVITEDDYIDFLARMTKNKAIPAIFAEPFQTRHFLFLGYGLRDWNLRVVLNRVEKDLRRPGSIMSWAIQYKPSSLERLFWQKRDVGVYDITLDDFVKELSSR
jgi:hypothetical protein